MRFKVFMFAPLIAFALVSCAHVAPIASCGEALAVQVIENDLSGSDWEAKVIIDLGKYGPGVVDCVVNEIISQASAAEKAGKVGASPKVDHAKAYRAKQDAQSLKSQRTSSTIAYHLDGSYLVLATFNYSWAGMEAPPAASYLYSENDLIAEPTVSWTDGGTISISGPSVEMNRSLVRHRR